MKTKNNPFLRAIILTVGALGIASSTHAADFTWGGGTGAWTDLNWNPGSVSGPTTPSDTAIINSGQVSTTVNNQTTGINFSIGGGTLDSGGNYMSVDANTTLQGGSIIMGRAFGSYNAGYFGGVLGGTITVSGSAASSISGGSYTGQDINMGPLTTFNVGDATADTDLTVSLKLTDFYNGSWQSSSLVKTGAGTLALTDNNNYAGTTTVSGGVLDLATGIIYRYAGWNNRSITINNGGAVKVSNWGDGNALTAGGFGPIGFVPGNILLDNGTLEYVGGAASGNMDRSFTIGAGGATLVANGSATWQITQLNSGGREAFILASDGGTLTLSGPANGEISKVIPGAGGVTKTGAGTWTLSGANTYTGTTTVTQGILSLTSPSLALTSSVVIGSGGKLNLNFAGNDVVSTLEINGSGPLAAGAYNSSHPTYGSYFTGSGTLLVVNGSNGAWTSLADGNWEDPANWASNTIATGFNQTATFNAATGATVTLTGGVTIGNLVFDVSNYTIAGAPLTLNSSSTPAINVATGRAATISATLNGTVGMLKTGAGTLVLTAANSYTGTTTINEGALDLQTGGETGTIRGTLSINSGTTVNLNAVDALGYGANAVSQITIVGGTLDNAVSNNNSYVTDYTLTGGTVSSSGGGAFNFNNGYGITTLASASPSLFSAPIYMRNNNSLPIDVADGAAAVDLEISGAIGQLLTVGGVTKSGAGTAVFSGANTYTGDTFVDQGTLEVASAGSLRFAPTSNGTTNAVSGAGTVSFLGTVDLDLSAANTTGGNVWPLFSLASYSGLTPAAVTSNLGSFTEAPAGTWELPVTGAKWVFTESNGQLAYVVTATDYDTWKSANSVTGGPNDDDDADGLTNHEEYAFGLDPTGGSSVNAIAVQLNKTTGTFSYTRRTQSLTGLTYKVWTSTDLATWSEDTGATASQTVTGTAGEVQTVQATITGTLPLAAPKLFIQVRAE